METNLTEEQKPAEPSKKAPIFDPGWILRKHAFDVDEVLDVGVNIGTPWLYRVFAEADFLLIDPQSKKDSKLARQPKSYRYLQLAMGDREDTIDLHEHEAEGLSTVMERTELTAQPIRQTIKVQMTTLDKVIESECRSNKIGIKIDTEGFEDKILAGLDTQKDRVSFIISEVSVRERFVGGYNFSELVSSLLDKGFVFLGFMNEPHPKARFYDCIFVPAGDPRLK